jgi:hypothetical protein
MQHLVNSPRGKFAQNQNDLLKIAMNSSTMTDEIMEHPICQSGFSEYGEEGFCRMTDKTFFSTVITLLKSRPSAHLWDVIPDAPYKEVQVFVESPEAFRMTFLQKSQILQEEFMRRPGFIGFRMELHNVSDQTGSIPGKPPSISITVYEKTDDLVGPDIPVQIKVRYRTNF